MANPSTVDIRNNANGNVNVFNGLSASYDGFIATAYADDYIVRGNGFKANDVLQLSAGQTLAFAVDLSAVDADKTLFVLPVSVQSSSEIVLLTIYEATSYTGGTVKQYYNANRNVSDTYSFVVKQGVTGYETTKPIEKHAALGTGKSSSGVNTTNATIYNSNNVYIYELLNTGNGSTYVTYDTTIYEVSV